MNFITNVTILAKHIDPDVNDSLHIFNDAGFRQIDRHAGGGKVYHAYIWAMAADWLSPAYRDDLFNLLKGQAEDCYLYEQSEDCGAKIFYLDTWGWNQIN